MGAPLPIACIYQLYYLFSPLAGAFVIQKFGDGKLVAPIIAGPFFILWPELSVTVGVFQVLNVAL